MASIPYPSLTPVRLAIGIGLAAWLAVIATLAAAGITTDEPLDVGPGRTYIAVLREYGTDFFRPKVVDAVYRHNAEHPPLGRWLLGFASTYGQGLEILWTGGPDPYKTYVLAGRLAPATIFGLLVAMVVHATARRYGRPAGASAGLALVFMPRVFAHAHFGALDTFITFFWVAALFASERALTSRRPILMMIPAGVVWSLALLTKIHAWFLIPLILAWSIFRLRLVRGMTAWMVWGLTGIAFFFLGWPWLWYDTVGRLLRYLGTGVDRVSIQVEYFGRFYQDRDVPWHYPWVYFALTVPVGLHLLGFFGLARSLRDLLRDPFPALLLSSMGLFLILFSTRVPVYDGERLFLMVFPLWAIFVGRGFGMLWDRWPRRWARALLVAFLIAQGYGVVTMHPFGLSYYNALVGGLAGADTLGLERTYWGDAVDRVLLDRLVVLAPLDADAALMPTLYPGQGIASTTRAMASERILLRDEDAARNATWVVVSRREAYWKPQLVTRLSRGRMVFERARQGVWLSRIYQFGP